MEWRTDLVGCRGNYRARLDRLAGGAILPSLPQAGEAEHAAVLHNDRIGLLGLRVELLPLVEAVRGNDAAAFSEGVSEGRLLRNRLGLRVDIAEAYLNILRPPGHKTPAQHVNGALFIAT